MIDALISGRLVGAPVERTGASGKEFVTCKLRVPVDNDEAVIANVIAFSESVRNALLALGDGDALAVSGAAAPRVWNGRPCLGVVAHSVLTAYHVKRRRAAVTQQEEA